MVFYPVDTEDDLDTLVDAANRDGVALAEARRRKERTYPELVHRAKLVLAGEVAGGPMKVAKARAREEPTVLKRRAEQGWRLRWCGLLACAATCVFAASLSVGLPVVLMEIRRASIKCLTTVGLLGSGLPRDAGLTRK